MHADLRRALGAVAKKILPVCPGDLILFSTTGNRLLVITSMSQSVRPDGRASTAGQLLGGLMSGHKPCETTVIWLDWTGYEVLWYVHRTMV
jgi:hypothetical protein